MSYSEVQIIDGDGSKLAINSAGAASVNVVGGSINVELTAEINGASINATVTNITGASLNATVTNPYLNVLEPIKSTWGITTVDVGLTGLLVWTGASGNRQTIFQNKGVSNIWIGNTGTISAGPTGLNVAYISSGSNYSVDNFIGSVYAIIGPGVSGDYNSLGIASFK